jgi:hypothetical protein
MGKELSMVAQLPPRIRISIFSPALLLSIAGLAAAQIICHEPIIFAVHGKPFVVEMSGHVSNINSDGFPCYRPNRLRGHQHP